MVDPGEVLGLEMGMRDVAEVTCEPKVFQQPVTEPCGPSSMASPCRSLQPRVPCSSRRCCDAGQRHPAWGKPAEEASGGGIPELGAVLVAPVGSHSAEHFSCAPPVVNVAMQARKKVYRELSNREDWDDKTRLDIF